MLEKLRGKTGRLLTALSLCLTLALVLEMAPVRAAEPTFEEKIAANGTNFTPLSDAEKTDFLLFMSDPKGGEGGKKGKADGMQGRWKMLTTAQVQLLDSEASAREVFGDYGKQLWLSDQQYSTTEDEVNLLQESGVSGIHLKNLAIGYGVSLGVDEIKNTEIVAIDKEGKKANTGSNVFANRYYFPQKNDAKVVLKVENGVLSLRFGQLNAEDTTKSAWKDNLKTLQIDTSTSATRQASDVVFTVDGTKTENYSLSDIVDAGQYKAEFAYYNDANKPVTAKVEGAKLTEVLARRSIKPASGDTIFAVDAKGRKTQLKSDVNTYLLAYNGKTQEEGEESNDLTSNSEFCLFGPGSKESEVKIKDIYGIEVVRKTAPAPAPAPVINPTATKILKLTKKKKTITVKWKKITGINGYQVSMATKKNGNYKIIKTITKAGTVKYTKKKLKRKKKYYFKVRTYKTVSGNTYYSPWSAAKYKKL